MKWLLKITRGPLSGAEIALAGGMRLKIGSSEECDIVIRDQTLPPEAFELDVAEDAVTAILPDGSAIGVDPYTEVALGAVAFAVGDASSRWPEITVSKEKKEPERDVPPGDIPGEEESRAREESPVPPKKKRRGAVILLALVLLAALGFALWRFRSGLFQRFPAAREYASRAKTAMFSAKAALLGRIREKPAAPEAPPVPLSEIARLKGLVLGREDGKVKLSGNLERRAERMAVRAIALAENPETIFDLTDDESLAAATGELLFAITEGAVKLISLTNRCAAIEGHCGGRGELEFIARQIAKDVPAVRSLDASRVTVPMAAPAAPEAPAKRKYAPKAPVAVARPEMPHGIAGILTVPYRAVIMRDGRRLLEGAQIGGAAIEKIEAGRIVLKEGEARRELVP